MSAPTAPVNPLNNIRRGELKRLLRHRGTSEVEVHNLVEDIIGECARWTSPALGWRMKLTFDEQIRLRIRTIACMDRKKWMVRLHFRERKRERDRMRWHRKKQTFLRDLSPMAKQIAELTAEKWMSVAKVVQILRRPQQRKREGARSAVRRALTELITADLLEDNVVDRPTGGYERFVRLKKPENAALLDTTTRKKSAVIDSFGEASDFRPPVTRPPVKSSPPHRRSSTKPGTSRARPAPKNATRLIDSYYTASIAKAALSQRRGRAGARSKAVVLNSDRPNKRAGKRESVPPSGGQLLCASNTNGSDRKKRAASVIVGGRDADLADLLEIIRAAAHDPVAADWAGIQERYHSGFLDMAVASLPDHHERETAEKYLLARAMRSDSAAVKQTVRVVAAQNESQRAAMALTDVENRCPGRCEPEKTLCGPRKGRGETYRRHAKAS
jgi:hypothetical protein